MHEKPYLDWTYLFGLQSPCVHKLKLEEDELPVITLTSVPSSSHLLRTGPLSV